ncbi:hypothetical protein GA0116948_109100 [Chitinophaga costaii]|uniref:Uncharacterized protein n=1 Tax=Chitinophaga costaii TaxID=1335309 RepID=A0A1C4EPQ2_9BACT|nr:hypothetical protein GA0116948_109100 [Chitinophaga costaii]
MHYQLTILAISFTKHTTSFPSLLKRFLEIITDILITDRSEETNLISVFIAYKAHTDRLQ